MKSEMTAVLHGVETPTENSYRDKKVKVCEAVANTKYSPFRKCKRIPKNKCRIGCYKH